MAYFEPIDPAQRSGMPFRRIKRRSHRGLAVALALAVMALSAGGLWVGYRVSLGRLPAGDKKVTANERLHVGIIGVAGQGEYDTNEVAKAGAAIVAYPRSNEPHLFRHPAHR